MTFSVLKRQDYIEKLQNGRFDVVIIGGGVTGAGALLDAQSRGMKACLIEMQDFSEGTSSRSTKLIHGGLRYLKQGDLKLVAEVGKERNTLYKNASHLTQPTEVIIPFVKGGSMGRFSAKIAMIMYEWLANVERRFKHKMLRKRDVTNLLTSINRKNLKGGVIYFEYKTNDSRLVIENIKVAQTYGGIALNYIKAIGFSYENEKISGVKVEDLFSGESFEIKTKSCVSAVGPWTDTIMQLDNSKAPNKVILTKGVHVVFSKVSLPLENAVYFEVGDGRMIFAIPKFENVYVGTTDTFYEADKANPDITKEDVDYMVNAIKNNFDVPDLSRNHVIGAWSGLRPLIKEEGKGESEISRKDEVFVTDSNLVAIAGGKLTGYRKMAEKVIDIIDQKLKGDFKACQTENIKFLGYETELEEFFIDFAMQKDLSRLEAERLYHWFGKQAYEVLNADTVLGLPEFLGKSLSYCFENEMITNPIDFLIHRTQLAYFDLEKSVSTLPSVYLFFKNKNLPSLKEESFYLQKLNFLAAYKLG